MKNKVLVEVIVPEIEAVYDIYLPINKRIGNIIMLLNKTVSELTNGCFVGTNYTALYNKDTSESILCENYDYVVDAIDMVTSKILLVEECNKKGLKLISSMGMGNKLDPTKIVVTDIHKTHTCPLAKVMRKELKDRRIKKLKVVYSEEQPQELKKKIMNGRKVTPGSTSFVPSVGGLTIASVVVNDLLSK